ncbi:MAG: thymidylate synthase [Candidatus Rokuibacteriota bacterium]|nr:MAG: thymidylate synthase [Candidatus Rokubacteria bacterium]
MSEQFTAEERAALAPYVTNLDEPVFALTNLPEVVKGALFARYSRSPKSLRRLLLDEFMGTGALFSPVGAVFDTTRAEQLYERVFFEYGDDSVAQLGGVHLACEGASNILTKVLEWGRLMAYLEQSTRYIPYDDQPGGRYRYHVPAEVQGSLRERYVATIDRAFETYRVWLPRLRDFFTARFPRADGDSESVYRMTALDTLRGLLPAATTSNVGIFATGQAYEQLLLRMRAHTLAEVRDYADLMLVELRKVIPAFMRRVDLAERGGAWSSYLAETREAVHEMAERVAGTVAAEPRDEVTLADFDPDGEVKVVAAALYSASNLPDDQLLEIARRLTHEERLAVLAAYVGKRGNRRHRPGRAFERTGYRFDVLTDYGAFRDLQRHRLLTLEWQRLTPRHGYVMPVVVDDAGGRDDWERVMDDSAQLHDAIAGAGLDEVASYAVAMAYRVRFYMDMNAREAMHVIELRTSPQGHPAYRRVCQAMHRLIADRAGHRAIAATMTFADHSEVALERLEAERAAERRRSR